MSGAVEYLFNFLSTVHRSATWQALRMDIGDARAREIGDLVAGIDFDPSWKVSQDPANAVWHGLCAGGDSAAACDIKKTEYLNAQWERRSISGFVRVAHAIQDWEAPQHGGRTYAGFASIGEALSHAHSDMTPPKPQMEQLILRTKILFRDYNAYCNGCLR
jgi:hypothetical protein